MKEECELSSYADLADVLAAAPMLLRETRRSRRLSLRAAAEQLGCAGSTLHRFESGETGIATDTLVLIVRWLGLPTPTPEETQP